jgi:large exoprotein involved in heme utilization and adhesion
MLSGWVLPWQSSTAQILPDATLPGNSLVTPNGQIWEITGGTQAGGNLFHSFEKFSVLTGETAFFNHALDIQNIFSRVTGASVSETINLPIGLQLGQNPGAISNQSRVSSNSNEQTVGLQVRSGKTLDPVRVVMAGILQFIPIF